MEKMNMDSLFHMATHGNKEAFNQLYIQFVNRANRLVKSIIRKDTNFKGFSEDFCDFIDDLFFVAINEHIPQQGSFSSFTNFLLNTRLRHVVLKHIIDVKRYTQEISYDDSEDNEIENIADPDQVPFVDQITLDDFGLYIASPSHHKSVYQRRRDKIIALSYAGYKRTEICKIMKLPYTVVRGILEKARDDKELSNIKLDLK